MSQRQTTQLLAKTRHVSGQGYNQQYLANVAGELASSNEHAPAQRKWDYLLSDTVTFGRNHPYGIRIQKPAKADVFLYCVKIIAQQQVGTLYIENHAFSDIELFNLTMLCKNKQVNLVNLTKHHESNVIQGPW